MDEELIARIENLENLLQGLMDAVNGAESRYQHDVGVEEFKGRNQDKLGKYEDTLKKLNGDDFDVYSAAYDEYNDNFNDIEEDVYIAKLVEEIDTRLENIRNAVAEGDVETVAEEVEGVQEAVDETKEAMGDHVEEHDEEATEEAAEADAANAEVNAGEELTESNDEMTEEDFQAMLDEDLLRYKPELAAEEETEE